MKHKIDSLFALSVLVLVLGVFALACSWLPAMSQRSESKNVARADAVASVTPETFSWGVDSNSAVVHGYGSPVICATAVPAYSLYENLSGTVTITLSFTGTSAGNYASIDVAVSSAADGGMSDIPGKFCYAVVGSPDGSVYRALSYNVQSAYSGDANSWGSLNGVPIRFNKLSDYSVYTVPAESINPYDLYWSIDYSGIESGSQSQWVALLDAFLRPSYDSAVYALQGALSGQIEQLETEKADLQNQLTLLQTKYNTLQSDYNDLQKKYQDLLYDYSLVAPAGTSVVQWGAAFKFSPVFGETSLPADNTVFYEGPYMLGNVSSIKGDVVFYDVAASLSTEKNSWYPSSISVGKYVCFGLPLGATFSPNDTITYKFSSPVVTQMMVGVYDSVRKSVYFRAFLNNVSNVSFSAFDYRVSNDNDRIVFYGFVKDSTVSVSDFLVPTDVNTLYITTSEGQESYNSGFNAGVNSVKSQYESQLDAVKETARQQGFAEAQKMFDNGNTDYSFFGLISAVIDAPIKAIRGLLNFDILGVNMFAFVTSLFSLAVVLMIVKLLLGTRDVV